MFSDEQAAEVYEALADWHERHGQANVRDQFLALAADAARAAGEGAEAERLGHRLMLGNPHHNLDEFGRLDALRAQYPPEVAADLLTKLQGQQAPRQTDLRPLPPTAPVIELGDTPAQPEPLKVYRVQDDADWTRARTWEEPRAVPRPPARPPVHARPTRASKPPTFVPVPRPAVRPPAPARPAPRQDADFLGRWVACGLFVLVLSAAAVLAAYTLVRPFLLP